MADPQEPHGGLWSVGIVVNPWGDDWAKGVKWGATVEFTNDAFCDPRAVTGKIGPTYVDDSLDFVVDRAKWLAEQIGVTWSRVAAPHVFGHCDGEDPQRPFPPGWRKLLDDQARRLGWEPFYEQFDHAHE